MQKQHRKLVLSGYRKSLFISSLSFLQFCKNSFEFPLAVFIKATSIARKPVQILSNSFCCSDNLLPSLSNSVMKILY